MKTTKKGIMNKDVIKINEFISKFYYGKILYRNLSIKIDEEYFITKFIYNDNISYLFEDDGDGIYIKIDEESFNLKSRIKEGYNIDCVYNLLYDYPHHKDDMDLFWKIFDIQLIYNVDVMNVYNGEYNYYENTDINYINGDENYYEPKFNINKELIKRAYPVYKDLISSKR